MTDTNEKNTQEAGHDLLQPPRQLMSQELFRDGHTTVGIVHAGQMYWLRLTRGNKLILTK